MVCSFLASLCSFLLLCLPQCSLLSRKHLPVSTFPALQSLVTAEVVSLLCCTRISIRVMPLPSFLSIRDEESWMVLLRTLPFPSPGKYSIDSSNRAETSSLQHNRQTNNPHTIYHKSLDPVFESGSLYRVNTHESLLAPLIILTCCCSQLV